MVNKQLWFYQTVLRKQTVVHLIPLLKNFFNPFFVISRFDTMRLTIILFIVTIFISSCQNVSDTDCNKTKKISHSIDQRKIKSITSTSFITKYFSPDSLVFENKVIQYFDTLGQFTEMRKFIIDSTILYEHHFQKYMGDTLLKIEKRIGNVYKPKIEIDTSKYWNGNIIEKKLTSTYRYNTDKNRNEIEIPLPTRVFYEYDKNGKLKSTKELHDKNIYQCTYTYNNNNQLEVISCRNSNNSKNTFIEKIYYNKRGLKIQKTETSYENDKVLSQYKRLYKYDLKDSLIYQSWYRDGETFLIYKYTFNEQGDKLAEKIYNDSSGDSTLLAMQYLYYYDKNNNLKLVSILDKNRAPMQAKFYFYNKEGSLFEERQFTHSIDLNKRAALTRLVTKYFYEYY